MAKNKKLNIVMTYGDSGYVINDLGFKKSPRFELYYIPTNKVIKRSNNPCDFDKYVEKNYKKED